MLNKNSTFDQIVFRVSVFTLIFLVCAIGSIYAFADRDEDILNRHILADHVKVLASYLEIEVAGPRKGQLVFDMPFTAQAFYQTGGTSHQYVIRDHAGKVLFASEGADAALYPDAWPPETDDPTFFEFTAARGVRYLGSSYKQYVANDIYLVQIADTEDSADVFPRRLGADLLYNVSLTTLLMYVFLIFVLYQSVRGNLRVLSKISESAAKISMASPDQRIDAFSAPEEIRPLVVSFNNALDRLEAGIRLEREFIANASHELRTPLSILKFRAEKIQDKEAGPLLLKDVNALSHLVQQLLDTAKLNGLQLNSFERVSLKSVVQNACMDMGPLLVREGRTIEVTGSDAPAVVLGDEWAIYRALVNLIQNAAHHTPRGTGIEITLKDLSISVRDHGPGIAPGHREKIFQSFWRQDASKSYSSGLGLAIVKRTMEVHGGTVTVEDAQGGGAVFTLKFPGTLSGAGRRG